MRLELFFLHIWKTLKIMMFDSLDGGAVKSNHGACHCDWGGRQYHNFFQYAIELSSMPDIFSAIHICHPYTELEVEHHELSCFAF